MTDRYELAFGAPASGWYPWFAWHPVFTADRGWRWLMIVNRRSIRKRESVVGGADRWFQHVVDLSGRPLTSET
jgi:hypothetical protein